MVKGLLVAIGDSYAAWFVPSHYHTAKGAIQKPGDRLGMAESLGELGNVCADRGDLQAAEEHYMRALLLYQEIGDKFGTGVCFANLGLVHRGRGDLERAEEYLGKALTTKEEMGDRWGVAAALANLGHVYADRGDLEGAEERFKKALAIFEEMSAMSDVAEVREVLGRLEMRPRRRQGLEEAEASGSRTVANGYRFQYEGATLDAKGFLETAGAKAVASGPSLKTCWPRPLRASREPTRSG